MKPKSFLQLLLLLPYLAWIIAALFSLVLIWPLIYTVGIFLIPLFTKVFPFLGWFFGILYGFMLAYVFSIVFWGAPYTLLVIGLFIWSKNKSTKQTYKALLYSPCLLAVFTATGLLIVFLFFRTYSRIQVPLEDWRNIGFISLLAASLCLIYGYLFVGLGIAGYKSLEFLKMLKSENEITQDVSSLITATDNFKNGSS